MTIGELANFTKLSPATIRLIDDNRFDRLPGGILTRGYLRAYAGTVGLDPEAIVSRYREEFEPVAPRSEPLDKPTSARTLTRPAGFLLALVACVVLFGVNRAVRIDDSRVARVLPSSSIVVSHALFAPHSGTRELHPTLRIDIQPLANCWIEVFADGDLAFAGTLSPVRRVQLDAWSHFVIRIGAPPAFAFTLNGMAGRPFVSDTPITVTIDGDNYTNYLASQAPLSIGI